MTSATRLFTASLFSQRETSSETSRRKNREHGAREGEVKDAPTPTPSLLALTLASSSNAILFKRLNHRKKRENGGLLTVYLYLKDYSVLCFETTTSKLSYSGTFISGHTCPLKHYANKFNNIKFSRRSYSVDTVPRQKHPMIH